MRRIQAHATGGVYGIHTSNLSSIARHRGDRASRAFTLVELLVVMVIIGLLIGLLLPSLRKARTYSRRLVCMAHLRGLSASWEIYAIEYGSPPQLARRGVDVNYTCPDMMDCRPNGVRGLGPDSFNDYFDNVAFGQVWLSAIWYRSNLFQVSNPPPQGPLPGHWWNWGLMWQAGIVRQEKIFFCPSMRDPDFSFGTDLNPWPPSRDTMWRPDITEGPRQVNHTESSYERRIALTGVQWDRIKGQTVIGHDIGAPKAEALAHQDGLNLAYRDGHVTYVRTEVPLTWWRGNDRWFDLESRRRLLAYSYWLDREGRIPLDEIINASR